MNTRWRRSNFKSNGKNIIDEPKIKQLINGRDKCYVNR